MTLTYPATLEMMQQRVRRRCFTEDTGNATDHWPQDRIKDSLNRAVHRIQLEFLQAMGNHYVTRVTVTPVANQFDLPQNCLRPIKLGRIVGNGIIQDVTIVPSYRHSEYQITTPTIDSTSGLVYRHEVWSQYGDTMRVLGTSVVTGPYEFQFYRRPTDMQAPTDRCDLPLEYHDVAVDDAAAQCSRDAKMTDTAAYLDQEVAKGIDLMKRVAATPFIAQNNKIRRVRGRGF